MSERTPESRDKIEPQYPAKEGAYDAEGHRENRKAFTERNERRGRKTQTLRGTSFAYIPVSRTEDDGIAGGLSFLDISSSFHNELPANIDATTSNTIQNLVKKGTVK